MATDSIAEFDPGPLTWVQRETNEALTRSLESLAAFREADKNLTALKETRSHVHQAFGATRQSGSTETFNPGTYWRNMANSTASSTLDA